MLSQSKSNKRWYAHRIRCFHKLQANNNKRWYAHRIRCSHNLKAITDGTPTELDALTSYKQTTITTKITHAKIQPMVNPIIDDHNYICACVSNLKVKQPNSWNRQNAIYFMNQPTVCLKWSISCPEMALRQGVKIQLLTKYYKCRVKFRLVATGCSAFADAVALPS